MKKSILLFAALLLTVIIVNAQQADTFYTQTFGSGIPGGWTNSGVDKNGSTHTGMWKWTNTGNHGEYYGATVPLASPTASDGWIIFDSDSLDNGGSLGQGNGPAPAPQRGYLTSTAINCTGHTNVLFQYYDFYASYSGDPEVLVSNGSLTDTFDVNSDYNFTFGATPNPAFHQFDISGVAANQANVTITFLWNNINGAGFYYFWQLDDIMLIDAPANDLTILSSVSVPYNILPYTQLDSTNDLSYYARVASEGTDPQPDVRISLNVKKAGTVVFADTSLPGTTLSYTATFPPASADTGVLIEGVNTYLNVDSSTYIGNYTTLLSLFSDSTNGLPYDNTVSGAFAVSDSVYAVDNGAYGGSFFVYLPASQSESGTAAANELASIFYLPNADTVTSITAAFDNVFSTVGATVQGNIYYIASYDDFINEYSFTTPYSLSLVLQTEQKTLSSTDLPSPSRVGAGAIKPVNFRVNKYSGAADAAILQPGFYAVSITNINDSAVALVNAFSGNGFANQPGGIISNGELSAYSNTHFYLRMNTGHGLKLLEAQISRSPGISPIQPGVPVTFHGSSNGTGDANTTYSWTVEGQTSGIDQAYYTASFKDTFPQVDQYVVCLTVSDNGDTAMACETVNVAGNYLGISGVAPLSQVAIVPNPTTGLINISAQGVNGPISISVVSMLGEVVATFDEDANGTLNKAYDLSALSNGIYLVKISNNDNVVTKKLSVSKQ